LALNFEKYGINPQLIKKTRTLLNRSIKKEKIIYCGLCSNTKGYLYNNIPALLIELAIKLPEYKIYFPYVTHWIRDIEYTGDFNQIFPDNVFIDKNPKFKDSMEFLINSSYGIFTCNGPSHVAYHLGIPRIILDPQFHRIPWMTRWKEDFEECIPINTSIQDLSNLAYHNIKCPQTTMIDRKIIMNLIQKGYNNWSEILFFKS
jgi:hypothetical protein